MQSTLNSRILLQSFANEVCEKMAFDGSGRRSRGLCSAGRRLLKRDRELNLL
jgi:hypothetical protein